jgi:SAM-dependent methyltransferase
MKHLFDPMRTACPLCASTVIRYHLNIKATPAFSTSICADCGFIFMNPPFSTKTIQSFYTEGYYTGKAEFSYTDERRTERFSAHVHRARLNTISRFVSKGRLLDIGSSFGLFLKTAADRYEPWGVELSEYAANWSAENTGAHIFHGSVDAFRPEIRFDVITAIEVIEHIAEPVAFLEKCYSLLNPNGLLVLQTADMSAWQAIRAGAQYHYFLPGHLSYFTERNLSDALRRAGFRTVRAFRPVDFGLSAKLRKSRGSFKRLIDYMSWMRIARYHLAGYIRFRGRPLTSSMVLYAQR